jgi:outer membrane autotransporter protein
VEAFTVSILAHWIGTEDGDIGEVTLALDMQTEEQYPAAFDAISPAYYATLPRVSIEETISQNQLLGQRMSGLRAGARGVSVSGMPQPTTPVPSTKNPKAVTREPVMESTNDDRWGAFVQFSGQFANIESFQSLADSNFDNASALVGMDYRVNDRLIIGLSAGYGYTELDYDAGDDAIIEDGRLTAYATFALDHGFWLQGTIGGAMTSYEVDRPVRFSFIDRTARGETEGGQFYTSFELGKDINAGRWTITPSTGFQFTHLSVDGFTETNAGALNLAVDDYEADSYRFHAGVLISYRADLGDGIKATPYAHASWQHEFSDQSADVRASLAGTGSFDWKTQGTGRDRMLAGAGVVFAIGRSISVNIGYQADFGAEDYESHLVFAQMGMTF